MAKRRPQTRKRTAETPADDRGPVRRHPAVWLATLSTMVGVATGMFTLRDQVFPREAGTARAVSLPAYEQEVGRVCDKLNDNDQARARDEKAIKRQLQRAKTPVAQRNAILDGVRLTATRSAQALVSFSALETPPALAASRRETEAAWERSLARLRDFASSLERASTTKQLLAALNHLTTLRPVFARDGDKLRSGVDRLGGANCDLQPQIVVRTFTLPRLESDKNRNKPKPRGTPSPEPANPPADPAPDPAPPSASEVNPTVSPPAPSAPPANPPATAPPANPPTTGGGGGD